MIFGLRCFACKKWFGRHSKFCGVIQARQKLLAQMDAARKQGATHPIVPYTASMEQFPKLPPPPRKPERAERLHPSTIAAANAADQLRRKREEMAKSDAERIVSSMPTDTSDPFQFIRDVNDWDEKLKSMAAPAEAPMSFHGGDSGGGGASDSWSGGDTSSSSCDSGSSDGGGSCDGGSGGSE